MYSNIYIIINILLYIYIYRILANIYKKLDNIFLKGKSVDKSRRLFYLNANARVEVEIDQQIIRRER